MSTPLDLDALETDARQNTWFGPSVVLALIERLREAEGDAKHYREATVSAGDAALHWTDEASKYCLKLKQAADRLRTSDAELDRAKTILAECGNAAGATVAAECSLEFMSYIPAEIKARIFRAEAETLEQARLNGMGAEREAGLRAELEEAHRYIEEKKDSIRKGARRSGGGFTL